MRNPPEADWQAFRTLREVALDRFCTRVLREVVPVTEDASRSSHERYLDVFHLLKQRDRQLAEAFDHPRRSHMIEQLAAIHAYGLLESGELAHFTADTRDAVERMAGQARR